MLPQKSKLSGEVPGCSVCKLYIHRYFCIWFMSSDNIGFVFQFRTLSLYCSISKPTFLLRWCVIQSICKGYCSDCCFQLLCLHNMYCMFVYVNGLSLKCIVSDAPEQRVHCYGLCCYEHCSEFYFWCRFFKCVYLSRGPNVLCLRRMASLVATINPRHSATLLTTVMHKSGYASRNLCDKNECCIALGNTYGASQRRCTSG